MIVPRCSARRCVGAAAVRDALVSASCRNAWWLGFVGVIAGWIVTESGRQPWIV